MDISIVLKGSINEVEQKIGRKILYAYVQGSQNYNLETPDSDVDVKAFCLPTFDDLFNERQFSSCLDHSFGQITVHDIRKLPVLLAKMNPYYVEGLVSKLVYLDSPRPESVCFIDHPEAFFNAIFQAKGFTFLQALRNLAHSELAKIHQGGPSRQATFVQFGYDPKAALHALRYASIFFAMQIPFLDPESSAYGSYVDAIRLKSASQRQRLMEVKLGKENCDALEQEIKEAIVLMDSFLAQHRRIEKGPVECIETLKKEIRDWVEPLIVCPQNIKDE